MNKTVHKLIPTLLIVSTIAYASFASGFSYAATNTKTATYFIQITQFNALPYSTGGGSQIQMINFNKTPNFKIVNLDNLMTTTKTPFIISSREQVIVYPLKKSTKNNSFFEMVTILHDKIQFFINKFRKPSLVKLIDSISAKNKESAKNCTTS